MAARLSRPCFTREEVVSLLDFDGEDGVLKIFLPGNDDELGFLEGKDEEHHDESDPKEPTYAIRRSLAKVVITLLYLFLVSRSRE